MALCVVLGLAELDHGELVVELLLDPADGGELVLERGALLHQPLGLLGVVPEVGVFGELVELLSEARRRLSKSKMPPQQPDRLLDLIDQRVGLPRAWVLGLAESRVHLKCGCSGGDRKAQPLRLIPAVTPG